MTAAPASSEAASAAPDRLPRVIGPGRFALIAVGITVATAIFRVPSLVAAESGSLGVTIAMWVIGAVFAFAGGLCAAELAVRLPRAGGEIAFLKEAYGNGAAFVFGFTWLLLVSPASIAAVARTVADYAAAITPIGEYGRRALAILVIALHGGLAMASTRLASRFIGGATIAKITAMALVVAAAFLLPAPTPGVAASPDLPTGGSLGALIAALVAVIWAYDGSSQATLAGDVKDPARTLPRGILLGTAIIVLIYLLLNTAYVRTLGFPGVAASDAVAADAVGAIAGRTGTVLVAGLVMLSAYSCGMVQLMSHPRVSYAMAESRMFFPVFARLSRGAGTPWVAILLHAAVAAVLAGMGGYGFLIRLSVFSFYPLLGAAYVGTIVLRRRQGLPTQFRMPLYPVPVIFYAGVLVLVLGVSLRHDPEALLYAAAVMATGAAVYALGVRRRAKARVAGAESTH